MRRLGRTQLAVLHDVCDGHDPIDVAGSNYTMRCRRETVAHDLVRRGLIRLLPHNAKGQVAIGTGVAP